MSKIIDHTKELSPIKRKIKIIKDKNDKQTVVLWLDNLSKNQVDKLSLFLKKINDDQRVS